MSRLSRTLALAALAPALAFTAACGDDEAEDSAASATGASSSSEKPDLSKVTLIVGDQKGTSAQALMEAAGVDDTPYKIEWKQFTSGPPMLEALNSDAVHVGMVGNTPPIFAAAAKGEFKAFSTVCTHQGCPMTKIDGDEIECNCHGSRFAIADGSVANGPASKPLKELKVSVKGEDLTVS